MDNTNNYIKYLQDDILMGTKKFHKEVINDIICEITRHEQYKYLIGTMIFPFNLTNEDIEWIDDNIHGHITKIINNRTISFDCGHLVICHDITPFMPINKDNFNEESGYKYKNIHYVLNEVIKISTKINKKVKNKIIKKHKIIKKY